MSQKPWVVSQTGTTQAFLLSQDPRRTRRKTQSPLPWISHRSPSSLIGNYVTAHNYLAASDSSRMSTTLFEGASITPGASQVL